MLLFLVLGLIVASRFIISKITHAFKGLPQAAAPQAAPAGLPAGKPEPVQQPIAIAQGKDITVSLTAKKKCFIRVVVDGKLLFEGALSQGAVESWKGTKKIEFKISDGSAVYLEVNGKPLPSLTSIRKSIKSLVITPSGISVDK